MGSVRGLLLDSSLLVAEDENGQLCLIPAAATLLRRLRYSKLRVGICYPEAISPDEETLLVAKVAQYTFECMPRKTSCPAFKRLLFDSIDTKGVWTYATSMVDEGFFLELFNYNWKVIVKRANVGPADNANVLHINQLEELLFTICRINKMMMDNAPNLIIGYVMNPSREEDFSKRGAFPLCPTPNGLMFVPLSFDIPLPWQMQEVDAILHKATDEIIKIDSLSSSNFPDGIKFSSGMQELERYFQDHAGCCIIDPLNKIYPLLDRLKIQEILLEMETTNKHDGPRIRAPHFLKVDDFQEPNLQDKILLTNLSFPSIVKPQVACGVSNAHSMALIFKAEHIKDLRVPLPAIVQEYVDHGSVMYKFYVLGEKIFYATRKSMPNADVLQSSSEQNGSSPIIFDSLRSLPTSRCESAIKQQPLDLGLVENAAIWLKRHLDLTVFGFDVVIQEGSGDHVVVDLNYFPSFREVPDDIAIPAFWDALEASYKYRIVKKLA